MSFLFRFLLVGSAFLVFVTRVPAQRIVFHVSSTQHASGFHHRGSGWGLEYPSPANYESRGRECVRAASESMITYAHGGPDFVPSVYMDYDKALELGKRMLEEQSKPQVPPPPLGDVARALRSSSDLPGLLSSSVTAVQDNRGRLVICGVDVSSC